MEFTKSAVEKLLDELVKYIIEILEKDPYAILREADLTGYLWMKLYMMKDTFPYFKDDEGRVVFPLHLEYPRLYIKSEEIKQVANRRFDIAILRKSGGGFQNNCFDRKKIGIAFEVKHVWDGSVAEVITKINGDLPAFNDKNKQVLADFGVSFNVNCAKIKDNYLEVLKGIKEIPFNINNKYKWSKLIICYLEAYRPDTKGIRNSQYDKIWVS